jgi:hypothetical protein
MKKIIALLFLTSMSFAGTAYIDNGDGTVTQTGLTQIVNPASYASQITTLQKNIQSAQTAAVNWQTEITALQTELSAIYAVAPELNPSSATVQGMPTP